MTHLKIVLSASSAAIAGLLAFGLAPSHPLYWGAGAAALAVLVTIGLNRFLFREEDSDPTIRPPNLPYDDRRRDR
jgi:hypothetical protein